MTIRKIHTYYFSPTGETEKVVHFYSEELSRVFDVQVEEHSFALPKEREEKFSFNTGDLIIVGVPVYAGRVPNKLIDYIKETFVTDNEDVMAFAIVTFGNRAFDNALAELTTTLKANGFKVLAAAAVVTKHAFSNKLGIGRPNKEDYDILINHIARIKEKIEKEQLYIENTIDGNGLEEKYYTPLKEDKTPAKFLKAKPVLNDSLCDGCGICSENCSMGSINIIEKKPSFDGICIKCHSCISKCPKKALSFTDEDFLSHVKMLENNYQRPAITKVFF